MEREIFFMGILAGMTFMQGIITLKLQQKRKPYIRAFAFLMLYEAMVVMTEMVLLDIIGSPLPTTIITGFDYSILSPFYVEVLCLAHQDVNTLSWNKRWCWGLVTFIPTLIYFIIIIDTGQTEMTTWSNMYFVVYTISIFTLAFYHLKKFHKKLEEAEKKKENQDVKWVATIVLLTITQYVMYMVYDYLPTDIIYFSVSYLIIYLHGHYIHKQMPADFRKMKAMSAEIMEQQREAIDELKDATDDFKQKIDMDTAIKAFRVEHPSFDMRLKSLTETKLTKRDIMLCCLIYEGKRIPEIAEYLGISPASVEVARHRLRGKLNLEKGANMQKIIRESIG